MDHQQINAGADHGASLFANLTDSWNQTLSTADPHDPSVAKKWREEQLAPALDQFQQGFTTEKSQQWASHFANTMRTHMFEKTEAGMSSLAGIAVSTTVNNLGTKLSNLAVNDPTSVDASLNMVDHSIDGVIAANPNLKGEASARVRLEVGEKIKKQIIESGARGAIANSSDPDAAAAAWTDKYSDYINGADALTLARAAKTQRSADFTDQERSRRIEKERIQDSSDTTETSVMKKLYSDDPKEQSQVKLKDIVNLPDDQLNRQGKERLIGVIKRELKPETEARISAQSSADIFRQMRDPNADPQKIRDIIFDARSKDPGTVGSITKGDMADLQKYLNDLKTPEGMARTTERNEFFKRYAPTIDPSMGDPANQTFGHHTALGLQKMYEAEKAMGAAEQSLGKDWRKLYDPNDPQFFGRPANLMKYQASMQAAAAYQTSMGSKNLTGPDKTVTGVDVKDAPPMEGAQKAPDGNWYIQKDGKYFRVKQ
jgi:hypothetical protein